MERMVTHVLRDADGDITHLCQPGAPWTPRSRADAIDDIRSGVHRYVVRGAGGRRVPIHVVDDHGGYLRSGADAETANNLDDLPLLFPGEPPASCPIGWQPSVQTPVFYGVRDLGPAEGAPGPMRVFFPSLDGAVHSAPVLEGCGRYPLALLAHGNCAEVEHYRDWFELPAQLARSGCVVAVPELPHIAAGVGPFTEDHPDRLLLGEVMDWMHGGWQHADVLRAPAHTGVIGHSWGALLAGAFAADRNLAAYVSLSGVWSEWPSSPPSPLPSLDMPKLFTWGTGFGDVFSTIGDATWDSLPGTKHRAVFPDAGHWDVLPPSRTTCENQRGDCDLVWVLAMDLVAAFIGRYLPPESWVGYTSTIPRALAPVVLTPTDEQAFFVGGHLTGFGRLEGSAGCSVELGWTTPTGDGALGLP
jgi:pimeloyl-ACP methyl ester carboxylesterase